MRSTASFCPQCGVSLQEQESKDLVEPVAEDIEEKKRALNDNETSPETAATQPLSAFATQVLAQEQAHTSSLSGPQIEENNAQTQTQTQIEETDIAVEDEGYWPMPEKDEPFSKGETAPLTMIEDIKNETAPLIMLENIKSETAPLTMIEDIKGETAPLTNIDELKGRTAPLTKIEEPRDSQEILGESNAARIEQIALDQSLGVEESVNERPSAKEKSRMLLERAERLRSPMKKAIARSQEALGKASPDPSIRFAIISIVLFIFFLLAFFLSRYLR